MCFGCECGDGWYSILDNLFGYLTNLMEGYLIIDYTTEYKTLNKSKKDYYENYTHFKLKPPEIVLEQVKEKYGTLRVYLRTGKYNIPDNVVDYIDEKDLDRKLSCFHKKISNAIDFSEYCSSVTCEITGKEGKLYTDGWHRVLCDEEAIKKGYTLQKNSI